MSALRRMLRFAGCGLLSLLAACATPGDPTRTRITVATYNVSLNDDAPDGLVARLRAGDERARSIARVLQSLRPDVVVLNEFDYDPDGEAVRIFLDDYLARPQGEADGLRYEHHFAPPVNTGVPSGRDLDHDGRVGGPGDAWGFGRHPGQYGFLVLSRFPIEREAIRTFQHLRWSAMPGALRPVLDGRPWDDEATWRELRLSSKTHADIPIRAPGGRFHFLVSHPTPPVFDGPEDRNGRRNHDEIRFWVDYLEGGKRAAWIVDDAGRAGGLARDAAFVIAGDLNNDPVDGAGRHEAILALLRHPSVRAEPTPSSGRARGEGDDGHAGDPGHDTGAFGGAAGHLRADYVIPSVHFRVHDARVLWPPEDDPLHAALRASDHRPVVLTLER